MSHTYEATTIANNILKRSFEENAPITPMKLQRVLYFTTAYYARLASQNGLSPKLVDEEFAAWAYGPVIPSVYYMFANYRKQPIRKFAQDAKDGKYIATEENNPLLRLSIDIIWNRTKTLEPVYLSTLTHLPNSAWYKAWQREVGSSLSVAELTEDTTYLATLQVPSHISF